MDKTELLVAVISASTPNFYPIKPMLLLNPANTLLKSQFQSISEQTICIRKCGTKESRITINKRQWHKEANRKCVKIKIKHELQPKNILLKLSKYHPHEHITISDHFNSFIYLCLTNSIIFKPQREMTQYLIHFACNQDYHKFVHVILC
jgi:hypothetical protein